MVNKVRYRNTLYIGSNPATIKNFKVSEKMIPSVFFLSIVLFGT